jgi:adenylate cyclase
VPLEVAMELWRLSGFPHAEEDEVAFISADVEALRLTDDLMRLGVLSPDRQAALVRTWGRSFARLAEWQVSLLADVALERGEDSQQELLRLVDAVLPRVASLQNYIWHRHLASAASRLLTVAGPGAAAVPLAVGFVDIVGYTSRSKSLTEEELVSWLERFEDVCTGVVVDHGGRVIKSLGDAVLFAAESAASAATTALELVRRGSDEEDGFPTVRGGLAYGDVVPRLGDVFGPTVNIASRLTSLARPGTVLVDEGAADALRDDPDFVLHRMRRTPVKGYSRLQPYRLRSAT